MTRTGRTHTAGQRPIGEDEPASDRRWALSLGLAVLGGLSWFIFGWGLVGGPGMIATLAAVLPALTCLVAGWLLRSWWGLVVVPVVYVAVSALMWGLFIVGASEGMVFLTREFALYVVLPAVVLAALGTAIGMYRARRARHAPRYGKLTR